MAMCLQTINCLKTIANCPLTNFSVQCAELSGAAIADPSVSVYEERGMFSSLQRPICASLLPVLHSIQQRWGPIGRSIAVYTGDCRHKTFPIGIPSYLSGVSGVQKEQPLSLYHGYTSHHAMLWYLALHKRSPSN